MKKIFFSLFFYSLFLFSTQIFAQSYSLLPASKVSRAPFSPINVGLYYAFLESRGSIDTETLYDGFLSFLETAPIIRLGNPGCYTYTLIAGRAYELLQGISFIDAAQLCNWENLQYPSVDATNTLAYTFTTDQRVVVNDHVNYFISDFSQTSIIGMTDFFLKSNKVQFGILHSSDTNEEKMMLTSSFGAARYLAGLFFLIGGGEEREGAKKLDLQENRLEKRTPTLEEPLELENSRISIVLEKPMYNRPSSNRLSTLLQRIRGIFQASKVAVDTLEDTTKSLKVSLPQIGDSLKPQQDKHHLPLLEEPSLTLEAQRAALNMRFGHAQKTGSAEDWSAALHAAHQLQHYLDHPERYLLPNDSRKFLDLERQKLNDLLMLAHSKMGFSKAKHLWQESCRLIKKETYWSFTRDNLHTLKASMQQIVQTMKEIVPLLSTLKFHQNDREKREGAEKSKISMAHVAADICATANAIQQFCNPDIEFIDGNKNKSVLAKISSQIKNDVPPNYIGWEKEIEWFPTLVNDTHTIIQFLEEVFQAGSI